MHLNMNQTQNLLFSRQPLCTVSSIMTVSILYNFLVECSLGIGVEYTYNPKPRSSSCQIIW